MGYYSSDTILPRLRRRRGRKLSVVPIAALLFVLVVAAPALAAKGGKQDPTLTVEPMASAAIIASDGGHEMMVVGSGFKAKSLIQLVVTGENPLFAHPDKSGGFSLQVYLDSGPCTVTAWMYQGRGWQQVATTTVTVP